MSVLPTACRHPGCPAITRSRFCPTHARLEQQRVDANRPSSTRRGYNVRWRAIRARFLFTHRICENCGKAKATQVDHRTPLAQGGTDDEGNLMARCGSCHSRKTASRDGGFGNRVGGSKSLPFRL